MRLAEYLCLVSALLLAACGAPDAPVSETAPQTEPVRSTDFAIIPCADHPLPAPCAVLLAGGKRVVLGAPAGVAADMSYDDLRNTDAVLLLSLRGEGVEGLDELRNKSWRAGRESSLPVGGPAGTTEFIGALNRAYEISDALIFVEDKPAGGFGAALLAVLPGEEAMQAVVFDTGDLQITKVESSASRAGYVADYAGHRVVIEPCGVTEAGERAGDADFSLRCDDGWQLNDTIFIYRGE